MPPEQDRNNPRPNDKFAPALEMLAEVSHMEEEWLKTENEYTTQRLLTEGIPLLDQVIRIFQTANETNMAAWTMLQKASLITDLAKSLGQPERTNLSRQALEVVQESYNLLSDSPPPSFSVTTGHFALMIETLLKIRDLFEDPTQIAMLNQVIKGLSAHFGEFLAMDLSQRGKAYDRLFTAQVMEALMEIEDDPQARQVMLKSSQDLALQAYDQLSVSSATDLAPVVSVLGTLKTKQQKELVPHVSICPNCGAKIPPGSLFCNQCGARLNKETQ